MKIQPTFTKGLNISHTQEEDSFDESSETSTQEKPSRKLYYKLKVFPGKWVNILYDRLTLIALLDRWVWQWKCPFLEIALLFKH